LNQDERGLWRRVDSGYPELESGLWILWMRVDSGRKRTMDEEAAG